MDEMTSELKNMDDNIFEQINRSLQDLRDKPNDNAKMTTLIDQVVEMNKVLHQLKDLISNSAKHDKHLEIHDKHLETHDKHLDSHGKHLESHDKYLEAHDHQIELLTKRLDLI